MIRKRYLVQGVVQGVGFRPCADLLAKKLQLSGFIQNTPHGVTIELEGEENSLGAFLPALKISAPALCSIESVEEFSLPPTGEEGFFILQSERDADVTTLIPPDTATCDDCARELLSKSDRRYRHPFINCTACGPRYSIIRSIPYDRPKTAMAHFAMCPDCAAEYTDVQNRRYHAQPVCCICCGPTLQLVDRCNAPIAGDPIKVLAQALINGNIAAIKGIGGFHIACVCQEETVQRLRARKHRDNKPFALMCRDVETARQLCKISGEEENLLLSPARPIVLLEKKDRSSHLHLSENAYLGVMLPYAPIHHLLFAENRFDMLVMTSANESELPMVRDNDTALKLLSDIADVFLLHDRAIDHRCDDSLAYVKDNTPYFVRRSRGYVPLPVVHRGGTSILACGAEQKASFCLSKGNYVFPAPHIGDLKNIETLDVYASAVHHFENLFRIKVQAVVCDLHPDFLSTRFGEDYASSHDLPIFRVQHHHAHLAACMADNFLEDEVLGIIFDGTGLGQDGTIWGGEYLLGSCDGYTRIGSIAPFRLPGGDASAKDPIRCAAGMLVAAGIAVEDFFPDHGHLEKQLRADIACHTTTSVGRLFDAMAALTGICIDNSYDSRAPQLLQTAAKKAKNPRHYDIHILEQEDRLILDTVSMFAQAAWDVRNGAACEDVAAGFMDYLARGSAKLLSSYNKKRPVVLSGGVFLNMDLLSSMQKALEEEGFTVYTHKRVSACDQGLSLGQLAIAQRRMKACALQQPCR